MSIVRVGENENIDSALRRFKRKGFIVRFIGKPTNRVRDFTVLVKKCFYFLVKLFAFGVIDLNVFVKASGVGKLYFIG